MFITTQFFDSYEIFDEVVFLAGQGLIIFSHTDTGDPCMYFPGFVDRTVLITFSATTDTDTMLLRPRLIGTTPLPFYGHVGLQGTLYTAVFYVTLTTYLELRHDSVYPDDDLNCAVTVTPLSL